MRARGRPAGGTPPPDTAYVGSSPVFLAPLAHTTCSRYFDEFPDHVDRYGEDGFSWCVYDTQYVLSWAFLPDEAVFDRQLSWLARVLEVREFPLDRLARNLELAADTLLAHHAGTDEVAERLRRGAASLRAA